VLLTGHTYGRSRCAGALASLASGTDSTGENARDVSGALPSLSVAPASSSLPSERRSEEHHCRSTLPSLRTLKYAVMRPMRAAPCVT